MLCTLFKSIRLLMWLKNFLIRAIKVITYILNILCVTTSVQGYLILIWKGYTCVISLADYVSHPTKVTWQTAFFSQKKMFFVWLLSWPLASWPVWWHMCSSIKLKHIDVWVLRLLWLLLEFTYMWHWMCKNF